jgi:hypothetical protein
MGRTTQSGALFKNAEAQNSSSLFFIVLLITEAQT